MQVVKDTSHKLLGHRKKQIVSSIDITIEENEFEFKSGRSLNDSQEMSKVDKDAVDFELARAEALRDATIAFNSVDTNGDGTIDYSEAEKLIKNSSFMDKIEGNSDTKVKAFFKSFDDDDDKSITKSEWLIFYGKLFDNIIKDGLSQSGKASLEWKKTYKLTYFSQLSKFTKFNFYNL